jgi:predicted alpha/beta hydrolase family esterase
MITPIYMRGYSKLLPKHLLFLYNFSMNKRLFIVHGWDGSAHEPLITWLAEEGKKLGFETTILEMPNPASPTIDAWVKHLESVVMYPDENTFFIGHSMGCQAIFRYLQSPEITEAGGVICIAPWLVLNNMNTEEEKTIARPWLENPINFSQIKKVVKHMSLIFSDNDPFVPLAENRDLFAQKRDAQVIVEQGKGHFAESDGVKELPSAIEELKKMSA